VSFAFRGPEAGGSSLGEARERITDKDVRDVTEVDGARTLARGREQERERRKGQ